MNILYIKFRQQYAIQQQIPQVTSQQYFDRQMEEEEKKIRTPIDG